MIISNLQSRVTPPCLSVNDVKDDGSVSDHWTSRIYRVEMWTMNELMYKYVWIYKDTSLWKDIERTIPPIATKWDHVSLEEAEEMHMWLTFDELDDAFFSKLRFGCLFPQIYKKECLCLPHPGINRFRWKDPQKYSVQYSKYCFQSSWWFSWHPGRETITDHGFRASSLR